MSEWGPWQKHDGRGLPVPVGTRVRAERRCGETSEFIAGCFTNREYVGPHGRDEMNGVKIAGRCQWNSWIWSKSKPDRFVCFEIIRYRIRKPKGLTILEERLSEITDTEEVAG